MIVLDLRVARCICSNGDEPRTIETNASILLYLTNLLWIHSSSLIPSIAFLTLIILTPGRKTVGSGSQNSRHCRYLARL
ncbi:hypothetical protein BOTBODRAFT_450844 [Botryobasidium botryosum FD-172 SS1]|uniref:Uncharacterized protein n=1 Tax=Botryobasidium botryosum (strain FD-172 SS1) TaxID=930990 RepID=A0A067M843_BOTB1|nr:hypothetical protein BOTBODRAFT_450844 [Botryobasidium botryosum FD-172 SS1]